MAAHADIDSERSSLDTHSSGGNTGGGDRRQSGRESLV